MTESEYFQSEKFKEDFRKKVERDTWEKVYQWSTQMKIITYLNIGKMEL